eukprot:COSAG06_NODE_7958_length_2322_cov_105.541610_4_plen_45_part_00
MVLNQRLLGGRLVLYHQVWRLDCAAGTAHHVAGTGTENTASVPF